MTISGRSRSDFWGDLLAQVLYYPMLAALAVAQPFREKERDVHPDLRYDDNLPVSEFTREFDCDVHQEHDVEHLVIIWRTEGATRECLTCGAVSDYEDEPDE